MKKILILTGVALLIFLLIPLIFNKEQKRYLKSPQLSELNYTEVFYKNEKEDIALAGMLFIPEGGNSFPIATIIHGSGTSSRNNSWYLSVTKYLLENDIAVLLPDKRGCEKSGGDWRGIKLEDLANDVVASIDFIKNQDYFTPTNIGIIGMSQGGWIAPVAYTMVEDLSFVVSVSGATVKPEEQLMHEEIYNISNYTYKFIARKIAQISVEIIKESKEFSPFVGFNPIPYWEKIDTPCFFAFGENDTNVPVEACLQRIKQMDKDNIEVKVYPNGGHGIYDLNSDKMSSDFLSNLVRFIKNQS